MKWSKYNYMFHAQEDDYFLYNALSNCFVQLDGAAYQQMLEVQKDAERFDFTVIPGLLEKLLDAKILTDNDLDEYYRIKLTKHLRRYDRSCMGLTIAPTSYCNFNCSYCYEASRLPVFMTDEMEDKVIEFVKKYPESKSLHVTWYGGEALLAFERIRSLTTRFYQLDVNYSASLITNGYEMDAAKVDLFKELGIIRVHITLDGPEEVHNERRPHIKNHDSFAKIIKNLDYLMEKQKGTSMHVVIRVNIDKSNEAGYGPLYQYLRNRYAGHKFLIYPGFVHAKLGACNSAPDELLDRHMKADFTIRQFKEYGIPGLVFHPYLSLQECMARHVNSYLIDPKGDLFKCWTDIGVKEKRVGNIAEKGVLNDKILTRYLTGADPFDDPECQSCFNIPICEGRCPHFALKNTYENAQIDLCHISKGNLKEFLQYHYQIRAKEKADLAAQNPVE